MDQWKKIAAAAALVVVAGSAGMVGGAWAAGDPSAQPPSTAATTAATPYASTRALLGGGLNEDLFVPVTPCRIVDTREAGGKLSSTTGSRVFDVTGSGATFAAQGGKAGGCGLPNGSTAIEATITAIDSGSGFLRAWPGNQPAPNATFMNYDSAFNISNTGTLAINGCPAICAANNDLRLRAFGSNTHVVVEVNGYYTRQMAAQVSSTGNLVNSNRASGANRLDTALYEVVFDRNISTCSYQATSDNASSGTAHVEARVGNVNAVFVRTTNPAGLNTNLGFFVQVTC